MTATSSFVQMLGSLFKAILYGTLIYLIILTISSILLWLTPIPESSAIFLAMGALCLASLTAGTFGGHHFKRRGFLYGAFYALILLGIILLIYSILIPEMSFTVRGSLKYILCLVFGSIGGMIAVNR